jgi:hypothetical protein
LGQVERRRADHHATNIGPPCQQLCDDYPAGGEAEQHEVLQPVAVTQLGQRGVHQLDLGRRVAVSCVVARGAVHAGPAEHHHRQAAQRTTPRLR